MIYQQMSIFDDVIPKFKVNNKIRLIEFFGGIGSQAKSLEILNVPFEHHRLVEWAYNSYCSYNAIHQKDFTHYSAGKTKEEMVARIRGTSTNYNDPLTDEQLNKKPIEWIKNAYNNCIATNNLINIMDVHAEDLGITEQDKYTYVCCYSFPCQDLSLAGNRAGMSVSQADGGSRSGLLWEVERILGECKEKGCLPQCLLLENVPQVMDYKNVKDWRKWVARLEELGYSNFADVLNAKDYGLPQNRRRCFMISILGEWNYTMPIKLPLQYRLKDMLEKVVDEKYYLSQKMIDYVSATGTKDFSVNNSEINCKIARPLTTEQNKRAGTTNYVSNDLPENADLSVEMKRGYSINVKKENEQPTNEIDLLGSYAKGGYSMHSIIGKNGVTPTFTENHGEVIAICEDSIKIKNATEQGYLIAEEGDGIDISTRMENHRGTVQKGLSQTLTCVGGENVGVVVCNLKQELCDNLIKNNKVVEGNIVKHSRTKKAKENIDSSIINDDSIPSLTTRPDVLGIVVKGEKDE